MPFVAIPKKDSFLGILVLELFLIGMGALVFGLYQLFEISFRAPFALYFERVKGTIPCYAVALILSLFFLRLHHLRHGFKIKQLVPHEFTWKTFRATHLEPKIILHDLRLLNATCIMFVIFVNMKHLIPFINGSVFDYQLERIDRAIFHGKTAGEMLHRAIGFRAAPILSLGYTLFYSYVAFLIYLFVLQRNRRLTHEFLLAFFLLWFTGLLLVYLYPTRGPVFYDSDPFAFLPATDVTSMQEKLWLHKLALDKNPYHLKATFLISGFPSLHLAVPILGSFYLARVHWALAFTSWCFVGLTALTTLYFGWHWLLDDVMAVVLAFAVMRIVKRWYRPDYRYVPGNLPGNQNVAPVPPAR